MNLNCFSEGKIKCDGGKSRNEMERVEVGDTLEGGGVFDLRMTLRRHVNIIE